MLDYLGIVDDTGTLFDESETVCTLHSFLIVYFGNANSSADQRRTVDSFPAKTGGPASMPGPWRKPEEIEMIARE